MLLALGFLIRFEQYTNEHKYKWKYSTLQYLLILQIGWLPPKNKMLEGFPPMLHPWSHWQRWGNPEACSKPKTSKTPCTLSVLIFHQPDKDITKMSGQSLSDPKRPRFPGPFPPQNRYGYLANAQVRYLGLVSEGLAVGILGYQIGQ